jgi:hypothetical protein
MQIKKESISFNLPIPDQKKHIMKELTKPAGKSMGILFLAPKTFEGRFEVRTFEQTNIECRSS